MKNILSVIILISLASCGGYSRIGSVTVISTRNFESKENYELIKKDVSGKSKSSSKNSITEAVENAVSEYPEGEFLKNVVIYVKNNGKYIKVTGDVWGIRNPAEYKPKKK